MNVINALASLILAGFAAFSGLFFLGTKEMHDQMLAENFWGTFGLRLFATIVVGLVGAAMWWLLNFALLKGGLVEK